VQEAQPATTSKAKELVPVASPPGRASLATRPNLTGTSPTEKTIGIVVVAALAVWASAVRPDTVCDMELVACTGEAP
jgi:hypothetical protein